MPRLEAASHCHTLQSSLTSTYTSSPYPRQQLSTPLPHPSRETDEMFTTKLGRVAHRATTASPATSTPLLTTAYTAATRPSHTRRHSSSKASIPPNNGKPAPDADAKTQDPASAEGSREPLVAPAARKGRRNSRASRHVSTVTTQANKTEFAQLPSVPDVQHLNGQGTASMGRDHEISY